CRRSTQAFYPSLSRRSNGRSPFTSSYGACDSPCFFSRVRAVQSATRPEQVGSEVGTSMDRDRLNEHLSRISTRWSLVFEAHAGGGDAAAAALNRLMQRYSGAVARYLLGAVRDPDT